MIVKRLWVNFKIVNFPMGKWCKSSWKGWFLFGLIPLYIQQYAVLYYDRPGDLR